MSERFAGSWLARTCKRLQSRAFPVAVATLAAVGSTTCRVSNVKRSELPLGRRSARVAL